MFMRNDRKFRDCSALYVTCWKIDRQLCRHLKLARKNSRLVSSPASHHGLANSIISSDLRAVFYSFSLRDNFYPESHSMRRAACFWHDKKNNSDDRDSPLKR